MLVALPAGHKSFARYNELITDTSDVELRIPSENVIEKYRADKDFIYNRVKNPTGFWEIISAWINAFLQRLYHSKGFQLVMNYIGYLIVLTAMIIVVFILYKSRLRGILYSQKVIDPFKFNEVKENIHELDFDSVIADALNKKEFRTAVRFYYLKTLKLLSDNGLIDWKINKTNSQYIKEIKESGLKRSFSDLTNLFEWIWYGNMIIEESLFEDAKNIFTAFNYNLTARK